MKTVLCLIAGHSRETRVSAPYTHPFEFSNANYADVARSHTSSLPAAISIANRRMRLGGEEAGDRVHGSSCAFHGAMRNILGRHRCVVRHVPRGPNRSRVHTANTNNTSENH